MSPRWLRFQLWVLVALLCGFGLVMIASTTATMTNEVGEITYQKLIVQMAAMGCGLVGAVVVSALGVRLLRQGWLVAVVFAGSLLALIAVLGVGRDINGARRWIAFGPINLQPAELAKFAVVIGAAWHFSRVAEKVRSHWHGVVIPLIGFAVLGGLVFLTRDLGSVVVMAMVLSAMLLFSGASALYYLAVTVPLLPIAFYYAVYQESYRWERIMAFMDPFLHEGPAAYHLRQSFIAIGSGGLFGVGLGESSAKLAFLPERHTDFIFAVICEELGLVGGMAVAGVFLLLVVTGLQIAIQCRDLHHRLLAIGVTMVIGTQAFWNMLVAVGGVPTKGLTLPFISYGGSSVAVCLCLIGILDAVARANVSDPARAGTTTRMGAKVTTPKAMRWTGLPQ